MAEQKRNHKRHEKNEVRKPFLTGSVIDEHTFRQSMVFFGTLIIVFLIAFIACLSATFESFVPRLLMNGAVIVLELVIIANNGLKRGIDNVKKGEILWQRKEKNQPFSKSEQKLCFHPMKGYMIGLIGSILLVIPAVLLALNTSVQMTEAGGLPSWMQAYTKRSDIGNALISYTQPEGMKFVDILRAIVRISILPYVNIIGSANKSGLLVLERLSPVLLLFPAAAYGTGYISGRNARTQIHTAISKNNRKRIRKEQKRRRARMSGQRSNEPEQLN